MTNDAINAAFEFAGAALLWLNVIEIRKSRSLSGVHWLPTLFFTSWACWNLFYYPSLDQWWSFVGACAIGLVNLIWLGHIAWYRWNPPIYELKESYRVEPIDEVEIQYGLGAIDELTAEIAEEIRRQIDNHGYQ